eukprot:jgi/Psemu1/56394/gm1.56394_g
MTSTQSLNNRINSNRNIILTETKNKAASIIYEVMTQSGIDRGDDDSTAGVACICNIGGAQEEHSCQPVTSYSDFLPPASISKDLHDTAVVNPELNKIDDPDGIVADQIDSKDSLILHPDKQFKQFEQSPNHQAVRGNQQQRKQQLRRQKRRGQGRSLIQTRLRKQKKNKKKTKKLSKMQGTDGTGMGAFELKRKQWKLLRRQRSSLFFTEDFRLREVMLYLLLCDVNLLLCQYSNDQSLKNAFDAIFVSAEIPNTIFPAIRFRMLSAVLEQSTQRKTSSNSNECCCINRPTKDALLYLSAISPVLSSCWMKEMNAFHALCHLKNLPASVLILLSNDNVDGDGLGGGNPQDNHHDLRNLRNCIAEYARAAGVSQSFSRTGNIFEERAIKENASNLMDGIRCDDHGGEGHRKNPFDLHQFGEIEQLIPSTYRYFNHSQQNYDFQDIEFDTISPRAKLLLFLISTLPAFLKITKTRDIRYREVLRVLSQREKDFKFRKASVADYNSYLCDSHRHWTETKSSTLSSPVSPLPPTASDNIWEI